MCVNVHTQTQSVSSLFVDTTNVLEMYMFNEILKLEEEIIRDEEFISHLDNGDFRSLNEIVSEITETLSININQ